MGSGIKRKTYEMHCNLSDVEKNKHVTWKIFRSRKYSHYQFFLLFVTISL